MSHISMSHVTHMNESCHTYEWVMSHIWMSHVTHINEPCHTYQWVMSHIWMSHVTHKNEPCHTYEWVMSHISMSHATHMNEPFHTYEWVMSHIEWVMSHIWMIHATYLLRQHIATQTKHGNTWKNSHIYISHFTQRYLCVSFYHATLVFMPHTSRDTHGNTNHDNTKHGDSWDISNIDTMGWLWSVGSLKLKVSFAEYRLFHRALLQRRPTILRSLLIVATP